MTKLAASTRDVPNSEGYWAVQVIAAYEGVKYDDYDPPSDAPAPGDPDEEGWLAGATSPAFKASVVFTEVVRDIVVAGSPGFYEWHPIMLAWVEMPVSYTMAYSVAEDLRRTTYHEVLHQFNLDHADPPDPTKPGDQGILDEETQATGSADDIKLNPAQLNAIRWTEKPTDS
jgi:hypothetical protein